MPEFVFNIVTEYEEIEHIPEDVPEVCMNKHRCNYRKQLFSLHDIGRSLAVNNEYSIIKFLCKFPEKYNSIKYYQNPHDEWEKSASIFVIKREQNFHQQ